LTVVLARLCTICEAEGRLVGAAFVARDEAGLEWYECAGHGPGDHGGALGGGLRTTLESAEAFFDRHFGSPVKREG
jgi:hypothetical protein